MYFKIMLLILFLSNVLIASVGSFSVVKGNVNVLRGNKAMRAFKSFHLESKDIISTSKKALAKIIFNDKTVITIGEKSTFKIEDYFFDNTKASKSTFKVTKGFFRVITGQIGKVARERFQLKTRNATIGIRGTVFEGTTGEKGDYVACISSAIVVCAAGVCQDVKAGEYTFVVPTKEPREPRNIRKKQNQILAQTKETTQSNINPVIQTHRIAQQSNNYNQTAIATRVIDNIEQQKDDAKAKAVEYQQIALQAQQNALQAAQSAIDAANSANEAFNRIVTAKNNVSAYEVDAYVAAQAAADSAATAAADAARQSEAAVAAAQAAAASQSTQNIADEIHQLKLDVTEIKSLASEELTTVQNQADVALEKSNETAQKTAQVNVGVQSAQTSQVLADINRLKNLAKADSDETVLLSSQAQTASDVAVQGSLSIQDYKNQAVQIESDAAAKLQEAHNAQNAAQTAAELAKNNADAADAADAAAAAAAASPGGQISIYP